MIPDRHSAFSERPLQYGAHESMADGACVMELVSYVAGERHSDHPDCVSPVIGAFLRQWNDSLPTDEDRDRLLKPLIPVVIGTRTTPADEETRAWMAVDWSVRVSTPAWLDVAGLTVEASTLRRLAPIVDEKSARAAQQAIAAARTKAYAAGAAARDARAAAARAAAADAAVAAAWDAVAAAWDAAGGAGVDAGAAAADAGNAAWSAWAAGTAGNAGWAAAGNARDAAWAAWAARDAGWAAAMAVAGGAWVDAGAATVTMLQTSAVDLIQRMAAVHHKETTA